jgi:glycine cleavage system H lipoate-binding protein
MLRVAGENKAMAGKGLKTGSKRQEIVFWMEKIKNLPSSKRPCIHHMKGRIDFKNCSQDYMCANCEFDQYFYDQYTVHAFLKPVEVLNVKGFRIPQGYYLHKGHAWVKIEEGSTVRIGLDDFALRLLGPLENIEAPLVGKQMKQNISQIILKRGENKAEVLSPVSGVVTDVNPKLREEGSLANKSPYADGWVVRIHSESLRDELKDLYMGAESEEFMEQEIGRLYNVIEESGGLLNTDGGYLGDDIYGNLPGLDWSSLARTFLKT